MTDSITRFLSLEDELAQRAHQQAVVAQLGQRALMGTSLDCLMDEAVQLVTQTLEVEYCKVLELLPDGKGLLLKAGVGWKDGMVGQAVVGSGLDSQAGYTLYSNEPVIVEDLRTEPRFHGPALLVDHQVISGISVIIQGNPKPYGVMGAHTTARRSFTRDDVHFLLSVANVLGTAIERKRFETAMVALNSELEKRVLERAGYVRLLQEVAVAANQTDSVDTAFQFVLDQVCNHMNWPVGHVYLTLPDAQGERAKLIPAPIWHLKDPEHYQNFQKLTMDSILASGVGLPGQVYATGEPDWFTDLADKPNFPRAPAAVHNGLKAGFAFPVLVGEEVVAVLEFFTDQVTEPDAQLLEVMGNIGTQLGRVVERQRAQEMLLHTNKELRESQKQLAEAQKIAHLGSWDWDILSNRLKWSEELYRIYGLVPEQLDATYEGYLQWVHEDDRDVVVQTVENAYKTGQPFSIEHRIQRLDGTVRMVYAQGQAILDESGKVVRMLGIGQDITERRQIEGALRQSLSMLENLFESAPDGTVLVDENGSILRMNRQMEHMFGYDRTELIGQPLEILLPERFKTIHFLHRTRFSQDRSLRTMGSSLELYARRRDGSEFPVDIMLSPLQTEGEIQIIAVVRDITQRRQAEEALRQSEARFRSIFEGAAMGIAVVDLKRQIMMSNPRLAEILGYTTDELRGKDKILFTHPLELPATKKLYEDLSQGKRDMAQMQKRYVRKDGRVIWGALTVSLIRDVQGAPLFAVSMVEDITDRKQMEAELAEVQYRLMAGREQERMQLAQEIHDVPLQDLYVLLYQLNELEEAIGDTEQFKELKNAQADGLRQVINTLRSICGELRSPTLSPFGLEGAIREHAEGFQTKHPNLNIQLEMMHDDQDLVEDVRLNLFRIYQQALNNVIRHAQASQVIVRFSYDENQVVLEIEDNGRGFEVPNRWIGLARKGHLGLVGAAERAEIIGGSFRVTSTPGKGTLVRVMVPRVRTTEQEMVA